MPATREAELVVDLAPHLDDWTLLTVGVGTDGAIFAVAWRAPELLHEEGAGGALFPKSRLDAATSYRVLRWQEGEVQTLDLVREAIAVSYVQPWPGGVLLAGARCAWRESGAEQNAVALDWSGRELGRLTLGDGINDLRVAADGTTWVAYFDEGVFGNYGWASPGPAPIGEPGLVAFSPEGTPTFAYDAAAAGTDTICDAYAMNVAPDGDVWLYFYTEFPIVRIRGGVYRAWQLGVSGARALAARGDRALLVGGYKRSDVARVVELKSTGRARVIEEVALVDPAGQPIGRGPVYGVGQAIYFFDSARVLRLRDW